MNVAIEALNLAKEVSGVVPAKAAFGSVSALLTMIRVRFHQFRGEELQVYMYTGFDDERSGLRRTRVRLC